LRLPWAANTQQTIATPESLIRGLLRLQLGALNAAKLPSDMNLPGWRWHALKGAMAGRWSVTVNGNWRITYAFENGDAILVDYEDYH
jgi:toxin HigB-1